MADVKETVGRALEQARQIWIDSPVINFVVGILVAYIVIYFITFYLGPVLFGYRPVFRPFGRAMHHVTRRAADFLAGETGSQLTAKVTSAIQDRDNGHFE